MPRTILKSLGLDPSEIRIYLTCLTADALSISVIAKKSGIKRTTLYGMMDKLADKGFVTSFSKEGTLLYSAIDPEIVLDKLKCKQSEMTNYVSKFEKIMPALSNLKGKFDSVAKLEFFEGIESIKTLAEKEFSVDEGEVLEFACGGRQKNDEIGKVFLSSIKNNGIKLKIIEKAGAKSNVHRAKEIINSAHPAEIKYLNSDDYNPSIDAIIKKDKVIFVSYHGKQPIGISITNKEISSNLRSLFNFMWKNVKMSN